jgi:hypothetical protein
MNDLSSSSAQIHPEDGGAMFVRIIGKFLSGYTVRVAKDHVLSGRSLFWGTL